MKKETTAGTQRTLVIVTGRCSVTRAGFGIRFEWHEEPQQWWATWAFAISESAAKREGYEKSQINGSFVIHPTFPGCPHCQAASFFQCGVCRKVGCLTAGVVSVTCPWCGLGLEMQEGRIGSLEAGGDT